MFPPTPHQLADVARVGHPIGDASPGAAWLMATAARGAEVQQQVAQHHNRDTLLTLHAHYAIEDRRFDPCKVAADLHISLHHRAQATGQRFRRRGGAVPSGPKTARRAHPPRGSVSARRDGLTPRSTRQGARMLRR